MYLFLSLFIIFCNFKQNVGIKNCSEPHKKLSICVKSIKNYDDPVPANLKTVLYLNEIIKIDGNENLFSISVELTTIWSDPNLFPSNGEE